MTDTVILKEYQIQIKDKLLDIYNEVKTEWYSFKGHKDKYCPRVDLAVGPFATDRRYIEEYNVLINSQKSHRFIQSLLSKHNSNVRSINPDENETDYETISDFNNNARCFLCIEIENKVSRKHLIGGLVNASALGRIGVLIAWTPDKLKAFLKLRNYLKFLARVDKNTFKTNNVLIVNREQFDECLDASLRARTN